MVSFASAVVVGALTVPAGDDKIELNPMIVAK
jgi:hypothetical protein